LYVGRRAKETTMIEPLTKPRTEPLIEMLEEAR